MIQDIITALFAGLAGLLLAAIAADQDNSWMLEGKLKGHAGGGVIVEMSSDGRHAVSAGSFWAAPLDHG